MTRAAHLGEAGSLAEMGIETLAERRLAEIEAESRVFCIGTESRVYTINNETRIRAIPLTPESEEEA